MYKYKLISKLDGSIMKVSSDELPEIAYEYFEDQGYLILSYRKIYSIFNKDRSLKNGELYLLCSNLSFLMATGLNITSSIETLIESETNDYLKKSLEMLLSDCNNGRSLSLAMRNQEKLYPDFLINLIIAGESIGNLEFVLGQAANFYKKEDEIKKEIKTASIYPIIVAISSLFLAIFLLIFIIPQFEVIYHNNNLVLPGSTKFLIALSSFIKSYFYHIIFIFVVLILSIKYQVKRGELLLFDQLKFKIPYLNKLYMNYYTMTLSHLLHILISSGITIDRSLAVSGNIIDNKVLKEELVKISSDLQAGLDLEKSIRTSPYFPKFFKSLIKIGQESGDLSQVFNHSYKFYLDKFNYNLEKSMKLLEPLLLFLIAIFVGFILISMTMPIFNITEILGG